MLLCALLMSGYLVVADPDKVGNPGFRQYRYRVTWKGETVVRMTPLGEQVKSGFSDFDGKPVEVFSGAETQKMLGQMPK